MNFYWIFDKVCTASSISFLGDYYLWFITVNIDTAASYNCIVKYSRILFELNWKIIENSFSDSKAKFT